MSESYREQHPLLCDDASEEEHFSSQYQRRYRPMVFNNRARYNAKGAAAIITQWPDHWTSSLTYWWVALGMIALIIFVIYNSVIAFFLLPSTHSFPHRIRTMNKQENLSNLTPSLPDVFMHLIINSYDEIDFNKYISYIEILSNKYPDFKYNFIIIFNDTAEVTMFSAEEQNEIAMNTLWSRSHKYDREKINENVKIKRLTLSAYMNRSPLRKEWKYLPQHHLEFLVRAISIWDKGGIAFNPDILLPQSPQAIYNDEIKSIFQKFKTCSDHKHNDTTIKKHYDKLKEKSKITVNNIRDIIDNLEHVNGSYNESQYNLVEAENKNSPMVTYSARKLLSTFVTKIDDTNIETVKDEVKDYQITQPFIQENKTRYVTAGGQSKGNYRSHEFLDAAKSKTEDNEIISQSTEINRAAKLNILPLFLEFLFHDKPKLNFHKLRDEESVNIGMHQQKNILPIEIINDNFTTPAVETFDKVKNKMHIESFRPMIVSAKGLIHEDVSVTNETIESIDRCDSDKLTIDLKGNILATNTACHAFLGTVFSNVMHHTSDESVNDLIIAELSVFCKGLLSSCKGIDVILI